MEHPLATSYISHYTGRITVMFEPADPRALDLSRRQPPAVESVWSSTYSPVLLLLLGDRISFVSSPSRPVAIDGQPIVKTPPRCLTLDGTRRGMSAHSSISLHIPGCLSVVLSSCAHQKSWCLLEIDRRTSKGGASFAVSGDVPSCNKLSLLATHW